MLVIHATMSACIASPGSTQMPVPVRSSIVSCVRFVASASSTVVVAVSPALSDRSSAVSARTSPTAAGNAPLRLFPDRSIPVTLLPVIVTPCHVLLSVSSARRSTTTS